MTDKEIISALQLVAEKYGKAHASRLEQLFRNETAHFKSGNFLITFSPGWQATMPQLPYGWTSLSVYWIANAQYAPIGIFEQQENNSKLANSIGKQKFMRFVSVEASMMSLAEYMKIKNGNFGVWFSTQQKLIDAYNKELDGIIPRFVNANIK